MRRWFCVALLLVLIGFAPWLTGPFWFIYDDHWQLTQANENRAWARILAVAFVASLVITAKGSKGRPAQGCLIFVLSGLGLFLFLFNIFTSELGPSSNDDENRLLLWNYWTHGGWVGLIPAMVLSLILAILVAARGLRGGASSRYL